VWHQHFYWDVERLRDDIHAARHERLVEFHRQD
jgi:hypothetical protein